MKSFNFFPYTSRIKARGLVTQGRQEGERERKRDRNRERTGRANVEKKLHKSCTLKVTYVKQINGLL